MFIFLPAPQIPPRQFIYWILTPKVMVFGNGAFGRWLGHDGKTLMNVISALKNKAWVSSFAASAMWVYREKTALSESVSGPSPDTECWHLLLDFPASRTIEITICSLSTQAMVFVISNPNTLRQMANVCSENEYYVGTGTD